MVEEKEFSDGWYYKDARTEQWVKFTEGHYRNMIKRLQQQPVNHVNWLPIENGIPPLKRVLIYTEFANHSGIHIGGYDGHDWYCKGEKVPVTHWAELPNTPIKQ